MLRLLRFELSKIIPYRAFWITLAIYGLVQLGAIKLSNINVNGAQAVPGISSLLWASGYIAQIFLGYLAIILICNEFENKTLRQHIINGLGRAEALLSKLILFVSLILISSLFILGLILVTSEPFVTGEMWSGLGQFVFRTFAYLSMALVVSLFYKKSAPSIAVYFLWPILIEPVLGWTLRKYIEGSQEWLPTAVFSHLLNSPFKDQVENEISASIYLVSAGYIFFFWAASYFKLSKADI